MRKFLLLASLFYIMIVSINAVSVSISISNYRSYSGVLQALYCMNAGLRPNTTPNPDTTNCQAGITNGQSALSSGSTAYIFSPQFTKSYTIPSGASIAVEIWAQRSGGAPSGSFSVSVAVVDSSGNVVQTIASNIQSTTYSGPAIHEWHTTITTSSAVNILSGYYIRVSLSAVSINLNIYWGNSANQRPTNFQLPLVVLNT